MCLFVYVFLCLWISDDFVIWFIKNWKNEEWQWLSHMKNYGNYWKKRTWRKSKCSEQEKDERFSPAGVLAPKSKADLAFIMHSLSGLRQMERRLRTFLHWWRRLTGLPILCGFISVRPVRKPWATKSNVCWKMRYNRCEKTISRYLLTGKNCMC